MEKLKNTAINGAGLGLRREFMAELTPQQDIDFLEFAPENWLAVGHRRQQLDNALQHFPTAVCHGLSLSLGSPDPLDESFLADVKQLLDNYNIDTYTEHLSYCSAQGQLYELLPLPFTEEAALYVAERIMRVQDNLQRQIGVENITYYVRAGDGIPTTLLSEVEFINLVIDKAGCQLLLDVNNIYVNSFNHGYDAEQFLVGLNPQHGIAYVHIAGHYQDEDNNVLIDSHGAGVINPVWDLLAKAYQRFGVLPTVIERDNNIPPLSDLLAEVKQVKLLQTQCTDQEVA